MARFHAFPSIVILAIAISACDRALPTAPSSTNGNSTSAGSTVEGRISNFAGTNASFQFVAGSTTIQGDAATAFDGGSQFSELADGITVQVTGTPKTGFFQALRLTVTSRLESFTGKIMTKSGSAPDLVLQAHGQNVIVSALTSVSRNNDPQAANTIAAGQTVEVSGRVRADGAVLASRVNILNDGPGGMFLMTGTVGNMGWTCPKIQISVNGYTITTDAATTFIGATCPGLAAGDRIEVAGQVQPDATVLATSIRKL